MTDDRFVIISSITLALLLGWVMLSTFVGAATQSTCLKAGYPSSRMSWDFARYCIKRVDQTDIVVPLAQVVK